MLVGCKKDLRSDPKTIEELAKAQQSPVTYEQVCYFFLIFFNPSAHFVTTTTNQGQAVAEKIGAYKFLECSARTNEGVKEVFEHATRGALTVKRSNKSKNKCRIL